MLRKTRTENGVVCGIACADPRITVFKGIPYATPPTGPLRWCPPQPAPDYENGLFHADHYGPVAYQILPGTDSSDFYSYDMYPCTDHCTLGEDCLSLNIWTPAHDEAEALPVYVWIHGGGLQGGYSYETAFNGEALARQKIVVVTVGYRLGPFGFLCHEELMQQGAPGCNLGFQDLVMALRWIQRNIASFGGNPNRVTIGGQSGGAQCVTVLTTSHASKGLFHGAITQSGGGLRTFGYGPSYRSLEEGLQHSREFLGMLGVATIDEARLLPAPAIMDAYAAYVRKYGRMEPVIDGRFLTEDPTDTMLKNEHHAVPVLLGSTTCEGPGFPAAPPLPKDQAAFIETVRSVFDEETDAFLAKCGADTEQAMKRIMQSEVFNLRAIPSRAFAELQAEQNRTTFLYTFNATIPGEPSAPTYHGSDMWFTFDNLSHCPRPFTGAHYELACTMSGYWANFIRTGQVNGVDKYGKPLPEWKPYTGSEPFMMRFSESAIEQAEPADSLTRMRIDHHFSNYKRYGTSVRKK